MRNDASAKEAMNSPTRPRKRGAPLSLVSLVPLVSLVSLVLGCGSTNPAQAVRDTHTLVHDRTGETVVWKANPRLEEDASKAIDGWLAHDLTVQSAVRVALLANPSLQADLEELGVAQADWVQAGLLKNPTFGGSIRLPVDAGLPIVEADLLMGLTDLLFRGARRSIAARALEGTRYRVADAIVRHVYETKVAFYGFVAAQQVLEMRRVVSDSAETALALTRRQHEAGTIRDLDLANEESLFAQIQIDLSRGEADLVRERERLNRAMGLFGRRTGWSTRVVLPLPPSEEPPLEHVESYAVARRVDLRAARADVEVLSAALAYAKNARFIGGLEAGVAYKNEGGAHFVGPGVNVELPIFDTKATQIARVEAELRKATRREEAMAIDARSEVRELRARLAVARTISEAYGRRIVPLREKIVALSQEQYDAMLLGVFQLIIAKQQELHAWRESIESLRDYWLLRAELEYRAGGALPQSPRPPSSPVTKTPTRGDSP